MEHPTRNQRLQALKAENVPIPDNRQLFGDGHLDKIMDSYLYEATKNGDADEFITTLEKVSQLRGLALSLIFDQVTPSGNSLLHVAASCGSEDVVELILIHFPYLVSRKNSLDDTPLHVAVQDGRLEATKKLISLRRDLEIIFWKNKYSKSPLYLAAENGQHGIFWLLLDAAAQDEAYAVKIQDTSPVFATLKHFRSDMLQEIINLLPKLLHVHDENGGTPLHFATSIGDVIAVQLLLEKCSYLALQTDENGSYPIHFAFEGGNLNIIKELVKIWPDLAEIKNKKGQNVLHVAAKAGNIDAVQYILKECDGPCIKKLVTSKDVNGNTPLHLASMHNHCPVLLSLTRDNRDALKLLNNDKLTALDVAMESESLSTKYSPLQGRAILIAAGIPRTEGPDIWSPRKQISVVSKSPRTKGTSDDINTRLVVATLVASVTFTAGITLPGGYNSSSDLLPGTAILLHKKVFQLFMISDMLAMYSSILAVTSLLWCHATDSYIAEQAYVAAGPSLFVALTSMSVAFLAAAIVAVSKFTWLWILVLCITVVYLTMLIMVFIALMFPFSKAAMRAMSLYYLVPALPGYAVPQIVMMHWQNYRNRGVLFPFPNPFWGLIDDLILRLIFNS